jgi:hypothetical protein
MRAMFWPTKVNPNPTVLTRFGRVVHWVACGLAALFVLLLPAIATNGDPIASNTVGFVLAGAWAVGLFLAGRALRDILSAE